VGGGWLQAERKQEQDQADRQRHVSDSGASHRSS
jgi:hypothetical protein